ncbi:allophanate hydrolase [Oceaniferula spumae]|uniref:Allophanate hydrolase n=1 Tax=Oceaniferula spumae TaxID=2979115 RepID=A0AAT9FJV0_9BACT
MHPVARITSTGPGLSYQDSGRIGYSRFGVAPAGPMDSHAFTAANHLLDNLPDATCLEITLGGVSLEILEPTWIALTGAASSSRLPPWSARPFQAGEILVINPAPHGIWSYMAFPGGLVTNKAFGSSSRHERSNLGPNINTDATLMLPAAVGNIYPHIGSRALTDSETRDYSSPPPIRVHPGPHSIADKTLETFFNNHWTISNQSDRTGFRLTGPTLAPEPTVPSLPVLPGTIQLPPSGQPIVTLNDGPTTGGYPILGIIDPDDLSYFSQHAPFSTVHFNPI